MAITETQQYTPKEANPEAATAAFFTPQIQAMTGAFEKIEAERARCPTDERHIIADNSSIIRKQAGEINAGVVSILPQACQERLSVDGRTYWKQPSLYPQHDPSMAVELEDGSQVYFGIDGAPLDDMRTATIEDQMLLAADAESLLTARAE